MSRDRDQHEFARFVGLFGSEVDALVPFAPAVVGLWPQLAFVLPELPAPCALVLPVVVVSGTIAPPAPVPGVPVPVASVDVPVPEVPVEPEPAEPVPPPVPCANAEVARPSARALTVRSFTIMKCFLSVISTTSKPRVASKVPAVLKTIETAEC